MKTITILNNLVTDELENDVQNRFGIEMGSMSTYTCENEEAEKLEAYLKQNYKGIRLCVSENSDKYLGALVTWNADPYLIENDDQALAVMLNVQDYPLYEIIRKDWPGDYSDMMSKLGLTDANNVKHIYSNGYLTICFANDWEEYFFQSFNP